MDTRAKQIANRLNVSIRNVPLNKNFPLIKCNIGKDGHKIYHLPFDQQYFTTKIEKPGEFYAKTVREAENAGFRRAYRWHGGD